MPFQTILTNTSGVKKRFSYIPPVGKTLEAGEVVIINGIIDTMISLGMRPVEMKRYLDDQTYGYISSTYPTGGVTLPGVKNISVDYQILAADSNWLINNKNAVGPIVLTLPPAPLVGTFQAVGVVLGAAQSVTIAASNNAVIRYGDILGPVNSEMVSTSLGAQLWLRVFDSTTWIVDRVMGGDGGSWSDPT